MPEAGRRAGGVVDEARKLGIILADGVACRCIYLYMTVHRTAKNTFAKIAVYL